MNPLKFNLDIMEDSYETCDLMQGYDYNMSFIMTDNYTNLDLTGVIIQVQMQKADETFIIQTEKITVVENIINVEIDKDLTRVNGKGKLQIVLVKNGKTFGSWVIKCNIKASAINDNDGQSESKVTITEALTNKITEANNTKVELDKSIANGDAKKMREDIDKNIIDIENNSSQLAEKASKTSLANESVRIDNLVAHASDTGNNSELIDIRTTIDGKVETSAGSAIRNQIRNFNGYNLVRNIPISDDRTSSYIDGKYYLYNANFDTTPSTLASVYTGVVNYITPNSKYIITTYVLGDKTLNLCNFYNSKNVLIPQGDDFYGYKVIDATRRIVEFTAPPNATKMTYTNYLKDKNKGFCKVRLDKLPINWLEINNDNLDIGLKNEIQGVNNALTLTNDNKISYDIVNLYDWGYYLSTTGQKVTHIEMGTAYFNIIGGNSYRVKVYSVNTATIQGDYAVIYFWDKDGKRISPTTYSFTVYNQTDMVIDIVAPLNAVRGTTTYKNDSVYYVYQIGGKTKYDWLIVNEDNLSGELKAKFPNNLTTLKYGHCLDKPFNFTSKSVTFFGDSITAGSTSPSLVVTPNPYCKIFADKFGMNFVNRAVGGTTICDTVNVNSILNKVLNYTAQRDFIFIAGGTNDWTLGKPIGALGDTIGDTFYGALHVMCQHLKEKHLNATVIFITPINQNVSRPNAITTIDVYRNAIFEVATINGFNVVDGSKIGFPKEQGAFANEMCSDGVHPSELGHTFYTKSLCGILI